MKPVFIILGVIVVFFAAMIITFRALASKINQSAGNHEKILKAGAGSSKKALVLFQPSLSSVTKKTAFKIAKGLHDTGYEVTVNNPGEHISNDMSQYAVVAFGCPVYGGKLSPVLLDTIKSAKLLPAQKLFVFVTGGVGTTAELESATSLITGTQNIKAVKYVVSNRDFEREAYQLGFTA